MGDVVMAERVGALDSCADIPFETNDLRITACKGRPLWRIAAWPETLQGVGSAAANWAGCDSAPTPGRAVVGSQATLLRVQPLAWWIYESDPGELAMERGTRLDISHNMQSIKLSGPKARAVLARLLPIDLRDRALPVGGVAGTMAHHVGVTLWRKDDDMYKLFVPRTFAASLAEAAVEVAHQL